MVASPAFIPVTTPVNNPAVAFVILLLLQVPEGVASCKSVVRPTHTAIVPVIAAGNGFTVTIAVDIHPVGIV